MKRTLFILVFVGAFIFSLNLPGILTSSASAQGGSSAIVVTTEGTLSAAGLYTQNSGLFIRLVEGTPMPTPTPSPTPCEPFPGSPGGFIYGGTYTLSNSASGDFFLAVPDASSNAADGAAVPQNIPPNPVVAEQGPSTITLQINRIAGTGTGTISFTSNGTAITGNIVIVFGFPTPPTDPVACGTPTPTPTPSSSPSPTPTVSPTPTPTPTAVEVSGRVFTPSGLVLRSTVVSITDSQGDRRTATTSSFGNYRFEGVLTGQTYIIGATSKRYRFPPRVVQVTAPLTNFDLVGLE